MYSSVTSLSFLTDPLFFLWMGVQAEEMERAAEEKKLELFTLGGEAGNRFIEHIVI
jgi:hypothetical protein